MGWTIFTWVLRNSELIVITIFRVYIFGLISKNMCLVVLPRKGIGIRIEQ